MKKLFILTIFCILSSIIFSQYYSSIQVLFYDKNTKTELGFEKFEDADIAVIMGKDYIRLYQDNKILYNLYVIGEYKYDSYEIGCKDYLFKSDIGEKVHVSICQLYNNVTKMLIFIDENDRQYLEMYLKENKI